MIMKNVSKRMYRFSVMIIFLGIFLLMPKEVMAKHDCSKYQCITCTTSYDEYLDLVFEIQSGGGKEGDVTVTYKKKKGFKKQYFHKVDKYKVAVQNNTVYTDWVSGSGLKCLDKIYAYHSINSREQPPVFTLRVDKKKSGGAKKLKTSLQKTSDNNKDIGDYVGCTYKVKASGTDETFTFKVSADGDNVSIQNPNPSRINLDYSSLKVSMFKSGCPKLATSCEFSGNSSKYTCSFKKPSKSAKDRINEIIIDGNSEIGCDVFGIEREGSVGWILQKIFDYIKVIGPILVVLLSAIDFIKAILSSDEKAMKQAQSRLVIRLIAAIALFLLPTLIQLAMSLINQATCTLK